MSARRSMQFAGLIFAACLGLDGATAAVAQDAAPAASGNDMAMPDDLGKPLEAMGPRRHAVRRVAVSTGVMTLDTPVGDIASDPRGKAILAKDLPGLCERPEYIMFKGMSLRQLEPMSHGRLTKADLDHVQQDLAVQQIAVVTTKPSRNLLVSGERAVGRVTHAIYKRVVLVVASL